MCLKGPGPCAARRRHVRTANNATQRIALGFVGEPARAIEVLEAIIRLDPFPPSPTFGEMGVANYLLKRYRDAVLWYREHISREPITQWSYVGLASAYAQLGQFEEARAAAAEALRINPGFTIESSKRILVYKDAKDRLAETDCVAGHIGIELRCAK